MRLRGRVNVQRYSHWHIKLVFTHSRLCIGRYLFMFLQLWLFLVFNHIKLSGIQTHLLYMLQNNNRKNHVSFCQETFLMHQVEKGLNSKSFRRCTVWLIAFHSNELSWLSTGNVPARCLYYDPLLPPISKHLGNVGQQLCSSKPFSQPNNDTQLHCVVGQYFIKAEWFVPAGTGACRDREKNRWRFRREATFFCCGVSRAAFGRVGVRKIRSQADERQQKTCTLYNRRTMAFVWSEILWWDLEKRLPRITHTW